MNPSFLNDIEEVSVERRLQNRTCASARAKRLVRLRNLANLTREAMCASGEINPFTLRAWELGHHGGIMKKGALKVVERLAREGVLCAVDWIIAGEGEPPKVIFETYEDEEGSGHSPTTVTNIDREIAYFHRLHAGALHHNVSDTAMHPRFEVGDVVAGIKVTSNTFDSLIGKFCIIQSNEMTWVRHVHSKASSGKYHLLALNQSIEADALLMCDVAIDAAAEIVWHRKP